MSEQPQTEAKMSENVLQKALAEIEFPLAYDKNGQFIIDAGENIILEVRGWSKYQHFEDADNIQDAFGEHVVKVLNEQSTLSLYQQKCELMQRVITVNNECLLGNTTMYEVHQAEQALTDFNKIHPEIK